MTTTKKVRLVHYAAATTKGLVFDCLRRAVVAHVKSPQVPYGKQVPGWPVSTRHTVPRPRYHTDLRHVTCPDCWREILRMAQEKS